jgi:tetratricopeptide (TPR) repeat protein
MNKLFLLGLCILCFIVYLNSLNNNFVLDDKFLIINNPLIKSLKLFPLIFQKDIFEYGGVVCPSNKMYRPLQLLTYSIDYRIWRLQPLGYHLVNLLLHLINAILVYYLLLYISGNNKFSKIIGILFLIHPIQVSVVSYISGRADLLASLFMLLSIILFLKFIQSKLKIYYLASLTCALLALFSRENALLLFLFIGLIAILYTEKGKKYWLYASSFILLNLFYILWRVFLFGHYAIIIHPVYISLLSRMVNFFNIIIEYIFILIFPLDLHMFRTTPFIQSYLDIRLYSVIIFILLFAILIIRIRNNKLLLFGALWFLIGIIPTFILMDGYHGLNEAMMSESWLYLSSIGFFVLFISTILSIFKKLRRVLIVCFIVFYSCLTIINNAYWENDFILHKNILDNSSESNYLRINLIVFYIDSHLYEKAASEINKFSIYYPDNPYLYHIWGYYYFNMGQIDKAIDYFHKAIYKEKRFSHAYFYLSLCYRELKQLDKAIEYALEFYRINPYLLINLVNLGDLYTEKKQFAEAGRYYGLAFEIDPENPFLKDKIKNAK